MVACYEQSPVSSHHAFVAHCSVLASKQAHQLEQCDVLFGAHGAGLANTALLRPGAAVIELIDPKQRESYHYQNLALISGVHYLRREVPRREFDCPAALNPCVGLSGMYNVQYCSTMEE